VTIASRPSGAERQIPNADPSLPVLPFSRILPAVSVSIYNILLLLIYTPTDQAFRMTRYKIQASLREASLWKIDLENIFGTLLVAIVLGIVRILFDNLRSLHEHHEKLYAATLKTY
jgi:hypothetical protein